MQRLIIFFLVSVFVHASFADAKLLQRKSVQAFVAETAKNYNLSPEFIRESLKQAQLQPEIIKLMQRPYEKKPWYKYRELFLTSNRIQGGMAFWQQHKKVLSEVEKQYSVPAEMIVSIIGVETNYGRLQGRFKVLDSLSTLAFDYPPRQTFFKKELAEYLMLCKEQNLPVTSLKGSYAGAFGIAQFMPSSFRHYAVGYANPKRCDLVNNPDDAIASVANYFHHHGWQAQQSVAHKAKISGRDYLKYDTNARRAQYFLQEMRRSGITPLQLQASYPKNAGLLSLSLEDSQEHWLAYPNFYVITRYNQSHHYALAAHLLAKELATHNSAYA